MIRRRNVPQTTQRHLIAGLMALAFGLLEPRATARAQAAGAAPASAPPGLAPPTAPYDFTGSVPPYGGPSSAQPEGAQAVPLPDPASAHATWVHTLAAQLVALEQQARQLELARADIRQLGYRIGKYISWTAFGVLATNALSYFARAEATKEALDDGRTDKAYDIDGDGDVDKADERRARRVSRSLMIGSLLPLGLGVWTTVLGRQRARAAQHLQA